MPFIGKRQLVSQICETIVNRRRRQHQDLGLDPGLDHLVHQTLVTGFAILVDIVVPEVVGFIDDDQIVIAPVHTIEPHPE